ncbi:cysteine desulfurase [Candidatus Parcubacteria bacterium]|nr:cysteine desulfurase [Candidatus Parcubacteria bacterium]
MNLFKKIIFLDHAAGRENPSAIYDEGVEAKHALEEARTRIARVLHVQARDIIFTSGGTESDNLALLGVFEAHREKILKPHIVISNVEHPAVRECAKEVVRRGGEVSVVDMREDGTLDPQKVLHAIKESTVLISLMYVNNETGAVHPISKISRLVEEYRKKRGSKLPYIHTDASQAATVLSVDVLKLGVDLMTLDASKVGGPKGAGLLVVRPGVKIKPILFGGGQERGLRPGTENVEAIKEFAQALEEAQGQREEQFERLSSIKKTFIEEVKRLLPQAIFNSPALSVPSIVSMSFPGLLHEFLAVKLNERGVCVSTGSSCKNINTEEREALRFSFGPETSKKDVLEAARLLREVVI